MKNNYNKGLEMECTYNSFIHNSASKKGVLKGKQKVERINASSRKKETRSIKAKFNCSAKTEENIKSSILSPIVHLATKQKFLPKIY